MHPGAADVLHLPACAADVLHHPHPQARRPGRTGVRRAGLRRNLAARERGLAKAPARPQPRAPADREQVPPSPGYGLPRRCPHDALRHGPANNVDFDNVALAIILSKSFEYAPGATIWYEANRDTPCCPGNSPKAPAKPETATPDPAPDRHAQTPPRRNYHFRAGYSWLKAV